MFNSNGKLFCCPVRDTNDPNIIFEKFEKGQVVDEETFQQIEDHIIKNTNFEDLDSDAKYYKITNFYHRIIFSEKIAPDNIYQDDDYEDFILKKYEEFAKKDMLNGHIFIGGRGKIGEINSKMFFEIFERNLITKSIISFLVKTINFSNFKTTHVENILYPAVYRYFKDLNTVINKIKNISYREEMLFYYIEELNLKIDYFLTKINECEKANIWDSDTEKYNNLYFVFKNHINEVVKYFNWEGFNFKNIISIVLKFMNYSHINLVFGNKKFFLLQNMATSLKVDQYDIVENIIKQKYNVEKFESFKFEDFVQFFGYHKFRICENCNEMVQDLKNDYNEKLFEFEKTKVVERRRLEFEKKIKKMCKDEGIEIFKEINDLENFSRS